MPTIRALLETPMQQAALDWLRQNHARLVDDLAALVAIPGVSTDGKHAAEIDRSAELVLAQMRRAGLQQAEVLRHDDAYPYVYGEWLGAPAGSPTVFLYAHHDVQPVNFRKKWRSKPWTLTARDGRLFGRGSADDKAAITTQLASIEALLRTRGSLPVNIKMLVEGEEEIGSRSLLGFLDRYRDKLRSDVIVVLDTGTLQTGLPSLTYSLRGIVAAVVEVEALRGPVHSGMAGGLLPDAAIALNSLLARLRWGRDELPVPAFRDAVRRITDRERAFLEALPLDMDKLRADLGLLAGSELANLEGVGPYEQTWRWPAVTVIAQEASSLARASNQVLPKASAIVSVRTVPDQTEAEVLAQLTRLLTQDPPWGVRVSVRPHGKPVSWWMTDPTGPAFEAAAAALRRGYGVEPTRIGCGGSIGFVGPLADLFADARGRPAPALLLGIEDPQSNAHAPNESLHEGDWRKLMASMVHLYDNLAGMRR